MAPWASMHRSNQSTEPMGRAPANFGDHKGPGVFGPLRLLQLVLILLCIVGSSRYSPDLLVEFKGSGKEEYGKIMGEAWVEQ